MPKRIRNKSGKYIGRFYVNYNETNRTLTITDSINNIYYKKKFNQPNLAHKNYTYIKTVKNVTEVISYFKLKPYDIKNKRWNVKVRNYAHGIATNVEVRGLNKSELNLAWEASENFDNKPLNKFEKEIFDNLRKYMKKQDFKNIVDANFWVEKDVLIFDTGY